MSFFSSSRLSKKIRVFFSFFIILGVFFAAPFYANAAEYIPIITKVKSAISQGDNSAKVNILYNVAKPASKPPVNSSISSYKPDDCLPSTSDYTKPGWTGAILKAASWVNPATWILSSTIDWENIFSSKGATCQRKGSNMGSWTLIQGDGIRYGDNEYLSANGFPLDKQVYQSGLPDKSMGLDGIYLVWADITDLKMTREEVIRNPANDNKPTGEVKIIPLTDEGFSNEVFSRAKNGTNGGYIRIIHTPKKDGQFSSPFLGGVNIDITAPRGDLTSTVKNLKPKRKYAFAMTVVYKSWSTSMFKGSNQADGFLSGKIAGDASKPVILETPDGQAISGNPYIDESSGGSTFIQTDEDIGIGAVLKAQRTPGELPACFTWNEGLNITGCVAGLVYVIFFVPASFFLSLVAILFDTFMLMSLSSSSYGVDQGTIQSFLVEGWKIVRDMANIIFLASLLKASFEIITGLNLKLAKQTVVKVLFVAITVNFSLYAAKVIIDLGNITGKIFYDQIVVSAQENPNNSQTAGNATFQYSISEAIVSQFNPQKIMAAVDASSSDQTATQLGGSASEGANVGGGLDSGDTSYALVYILVILCMTAICLFGGMIFFQMAMLFAGRVAELWVLMITGPIYFSNHISNLIGDEYSLKNYFKKLFSNSLLVAVFSFFIYLIVMLMGQANGLGFFDTAANAVTSSVSVGLISTVVKVLVPMMIILLLLKKGMQVSSEMATGVASWVVNSTEGFAKGLAGVAGGAVFGAGLGLVGGGLARAGSGTLGRLGGNQALKEWSDKLSQKKSMTGLGIRSRIGTGIGSSLENLKKGSYDFRNTDAFKKGQDLVNKKAGFRMIGSNSYLTDMGGLNSGDLADGRGYEKDENGNIRRDAKGNPIRTRDEKIRARRAKAYEKIFGRKNTDTPLTDEQVEQSKSERAAYRNALGWNEDKYREEEAKFTNTKISEDLTRAELAGEFDEKKIAAELIKEDPSLGDPANAGKLSTLVKQKIADKKRGIEQNTKASIQKNGDFLKDVKDKVKKEKWASDEDVEKVRKERMEAKRERMKKANEEMLAEMKKDPKDRDKKKIYDLDQEILRLAREETEIEKMPAENIKKDLIEKNEKLLKKEYSGFAKTAEELNKSRQKAKDEEFEEWIKTAPMTKEQREQMLREFDAKRKSESAKKVESAKFDEVDGYLLSALKFAHESSDSDTKKTVSELAKLAGKDIDTIMKEKDGVKKFLDHLYEKGLEGEIKTVLGKISGDMKDYKDNARKEYIRLTDDNKKAQKEISTLIKDLTQKKADLAKETDATKKTILESEIKNLKNNYKIQSDIVQEYQKAEVTFTNAKNIADKIAKEKNHENLIKAGKVKRTKKEEPKT